MSDLSADDPKASGSVATTGHGEIAQFEDPGLPPHRPRLADVSPKAARRAERQVAALFIVSFLGSAIFFYAYFFIKVDASIGVLSLQNLFLGLGTALAMLGIGVGVVHWAKTLMPDHEIAEDRHELRPEADREEAAAILNQVLDEAGIKRRPLIRNTLIAAGVASLVPTVILLRDLGPLPGTALRHTLWDKGTRLAHDPTGVPIKAADVTVGSVFHVVPETLKDSDDMLEEKAKSVVLLMRLNPEDLHPSKGRENWNYDGIVAYSKICTHVGCPVALYEQQTHHLLCPCHQSTFDLTQECKVIFGPAAHALPQLPITVDDDGYLVAQSDFHEPVGPSYWDRG